MADDDSSLLASEPDWCRSVVACVGKYDAWVSQKGLGKKKRKKESYHACNMIVDTTCVEQREQQEDEWWCSDHGIGVTWSASRIKDDGDGWPRP
jgi:hypothetical protein